MKSFTKVSKRTYTPLWINLNFSKYAKEFKDIRDKMAYKANSCIKCRRKFEMNEPIALACFKGIGNKVMCQECAKSLT